LINGGGEEGTVGFSPERKKKGRDKGGEKSLKVNDMRRLVLSRSIVSPSPVNGAVKKRKTTKKEGEGETSERETSGSSQTRKLPIVGENT